MTLTVEPTEGGEACTADAVLRKDRIYEASFDMEIPDPLYVRITAVVHGESRDYEGVVFEGDLGLGHRERFLDYVDLLSGLTDDPRYTVILTVADEGTKALTWADRASLASLGLETDLSDHYRDSYYAVINKNTITEEAASQKLIYEGELPDGTPLTVVSAGYEFGSEASILIDGQEYASSETGMHFVIYDSEMAQVISTAYFNTHKDEHPAYYLKMAVGGTSASARSFTITDSPLANYMGRVYAHVWDDSTYTEPLTVEFKKHNDGTITAEGDLKGVDLSACYLELYLHKKTNETLLLGRWSGDLADGTVIEMRGSL